MRHHRRILAGLAVAAAVSGGSAAYAFVAGQDATTGSAPSFATLRGANEVPKGDADGVGAASVQAVSATKICFSLIVNGIATPNQAHIHKGPPGVAGPVVVPLKQPAKGSGGTSSGCATAPSATVSAIAKTPGAFYVNVHNAAFPAGALRGQLRAVK